MDNCEHLIAGVARHVDELLRRCPRVSVVATSREPVGLRGERIWRLAPLDPDDAAVELFCERASLTGDVDPTSRATWQSCAASSTAFRSPSSLPPPVATCSPLPTSWLGWDGDLASCTATIRQSAPASEAWTRRSSGAISCCAPRSSSRSGASARSPQGSGWRRRARPLPTTSIDAYDVPELVWSLVSKSLIGNEAGSRLDPLPDARDRAGVRPATARSTRRNSPSGRCA